MGDEAIVVGFIEGHSEYEARNRTAIQALPISVEGDSFPWLNQTIFAFPGPRPIGQYRSSVIHFGMSVKALWYEWLPWINKFQFLLNQMYSYGAYLRFEGRTTSVEVKWRVKNSFQGNALEWQRTIQHRTDVIPIDYWQQNQPTNFSVQFRVGDELPDIEPSWKPSAKLLNFLE